MPKTLKVILTTLAALVTLVVLVLVGVNLYLQSPRTQGRIQEGLSEALRMPVRFVTTSISPAGRLKITGISIPDGERNFLEASAFSARYRLGALLRGRLEIYEMSVERPKIVWRQDAQGHWAVPKAPAVPGAAVEMPKEKKEKKEKTKEKEIGAPAQESGKRSGLVVVVEGFQIRNGSVALLDVDGRTAADFSGVNVTYTTLTAERMAGTAQLARVAWSDSLVLEKVQTPFLYAGKELSLPELQATLAGGKVTGRATLKLDGKRAPFTLALEFAEIEAGQLNAQIHSALGNASGAIHGQLELRGSSKEIAWGEGAGRLQIRDGRFQKLELFEAIGEVLQIKELADLRLNDGHANFRVGDHKVHLDEILLDGANLRLGAKGLVRLDGKIQLTAQLSIDEALRKSLDKLVRGNFQETDDHRYALDFEITGKDYKPKTNLLDQFVGKKIKGEFDDLLTSLFGSKKKEEAKKDDKKKTDEKKTEEKKDGAKNSEAPAPTGPAVAPPPAAADPAQPAAKP